MVEHPTPRIPVPRWLIVLGIWTMPAVVSWSGLLVTPLFEPDAQVPMARALLLQLALWWFWAAATPVIAQLRRRRPVASPGLPSAIAMHLGASLLFAVVHAAFNAVVVILLFAEPQWSGVWEFTLRFLQTRGQFGVLTYWAALGVLTASDYHRQLRDRERAAAEMHQRLTQAELEALKMQLQPHFFFNTLHAIGVLVRDDPRAASRTVARLGALMRRTLDAGDAPEVPLATELEVLELYLDIQRTRFSDRLGVTIDVPAALHQAAVPNLVLQPLVENAIRHGVEPRPGPAAIRVTAERADGTLVLTVTDDGPGLLPGARDGIGLANSRARLRALYGAEGTLDVSNDPAGGVRATVCLPFRRMRSDAP